MNVDEKRIDLEMSMYSLDVEISRISNLIHDIGGVDRIYLKELAARLNNLSNKAK